MGTGPFAVPTFEWLIDSPHEVLGLITRPTRPSRGRQGPPPNPMRSTAESHGVEVYAPESINEPTSIELLKQFDADLFVVCDYGQILSREALATAKLGGINLHGSLLPKYRGAAPINWAMLAGDTEVGITVIHMTAKLDGGPALAKRSIELNDDDTAVEAEEKLSRIGVEAVADSIDQLSEWDGARPIGELQDPALATRAPRLSKRDGLIDWSHSAVEIRNRLKALQPWPGVYTNWHGKKHPLRLIVFMDDDRRRATVRRGSWHGDSLRRAVALDCHGRRRDLDRPDSTGWQTINGDRGVSPRPCNPGRRPVGVIGDPIDRPSLPKRQSPLCR